MLQNQLKKNTICEYRIIDRYCSNIVNLFPYKFQECEKYNILASNVTI